MRRGGVGGNVAVDDADERQMMTTDERREAGHG